MDEISEGRINKISKLAGCSADEVRALLNNPWPYAQAHWAWVRNADDDIIAEWIKHHIQQ